MIRSYVLTLLLLFLYACSIAGQSEAPKRLFPITANGKYGFVDRYGNIVIQPRFLMASDFHDGLASVKIDGRYGYINETGEVVVAPQYNDAEDFSEGFAV